jgi:hypothetical protein
LSAVEVDVLGTGSGVDADLIGTTETGETEELAIVPSIEADLTGAGGAVVLRCQTNKNTDVTISTQ